jgi:IS5 family transposase
MAFYTVRSERQFCEQLDYNLLFRWFLDMALDDRSFDPTTFTHNRERLLAHEVAEKFFLEVVEQARAAGLVSDEHFTVDGTLIEAWASLKSLKRKDGQGQKSDPPDDAGNPTVDFHGERRGNETHESSTDPESRLARKGKGKEARLCFSQHVLMENRNGLVVDVRVTSVDTTEREAAIDMMDDSLAGSRRITVAGDKGYDTRGFAKACRERKVTPHVAQALGRSGGSSIDGRTTRHSGYAISQRIRKRVEEIFGWTKTVGNFRKSRYRGVKRTGFASFLIGAAYNLVRMSRLLGAEA